MSNSGTAFMNNPKIADLLRDAIDAPVGSTKRERARSTVAILRRTSAAHKGKGGPGASTYSPSSPGTSFFLVRSPKADPNMTTMALASTPPAPNRGNPQTKAMAQAENLPQAAPEPAASPAPYQPASVDIPQTNLNSSSATRSDYSEVDMNALSHKGQGGPGFMDQFSQPGAGANFGALSPSINLGTGKGSSFLTGKGFNLSPATAPAPSRVSTPLTGRGLTPSSSINLGSLTGGFSGLTGGGLSRLTGGGLTPLTAGTGGLTSRGLTPLTGGLTMGSYPALAGSLDKRNSDTATTTAPVVAETTATDSGTAFTDTPPSGAGVSGASGTNPGLSAQSAVNSNMGAAGFANAAMANPELLKEIFPGMTIPAGSLTEEVAKLQNTLRDTYNIKGLQGQMQQMIASGVTLGPMLTNYIQGQDESLKAINNQRTAARDLMLRADTGNAGSSAIWTRYMDYLDGLYNSQNTSYADFYNKSIGMYQAGLTALGTETTNAINQYNSELQTGTALSEADFNRMYTGLTDMYTSIENAPIRELERKTLQLQYDQALGIAINGVIEGGEGGWSEAYKKLSDQGILFSNEKGNEGALLPNVTNIGAALETILSDAPKIGLNGAMYVLGQGFQKALSAGTSPDEGLPNAARFTTMVLEGVQNGDLTPETAQQLTATIGQAAGDSVEAYLSNEKTAEPARAAYTWALTGDGGGWFASNKVPTQADFVSKYKGKLPDQLLTYMYLTAQTARNAIEQGYSQGTYGGLTSTDLYKAYKEEIAGLSTPQQVGSYIGDSISAYIAGTALQALNLTAQ